MQIFLLWHRKERTPASPENGGAARMAGEMVERYQPHILQRLNHRVASVGSTGLIYLTEKPLEENAPFFHEQPGEVAFSIGTPTGLDEIIDGKESGADLLPHLRRRFDTDGPELIKAISPPFLFGFVEAEGFRLLHDGLGLEQVFRYEDRNVWVCSNRCWPIQRFFAKRFGVDDTAWQHYFEVGNFPRLSTPFQGIEMLDRGAVFTCRNGKITRERIDCFHEWFRPMGMGEDELMEFGRINFNNAVRELTRRYGGGGLQVDLSGGRDTRMILSSLMHQKIPGRFKTVGDSYSADVRVVRKLEKRYGLEVEFVNPSLESTDRSVIETKIDRLINWKDGVGEFKSSKYMNTDPVAIPPTPILSGNLGGIYRAFYPRDYFRFSAVKEARKAIKRVIGRTPRIMKNNWRRENVKRIVFREGARYGLSDYYLLDYYNIVEKTRRWGSAVIATPYNGYLLPYVNIGLLKVNFSIPMKDKAAAKLHTHAIRTNAPGLEKIPYDTDLIARDDSLSKTPYNEDYFWRGPNGRTIMEKILEKDHYLWDNILRRRGVRRMWDELRSEKARHGGFFWRIVGFCRWYSAFAG